MKETYTIYDIAREAGVSVATVTRAFKPDGVISQKTREKILRIASAHDYQANKAAANLTKDTIYIGILILRDIFIFYNELIRGIESAVSELSAYKIRYDLVLIDKNDDLMNDTYVKAIERYMRESYDGIIIKCSNPSERLIAKMNEASEAGIAVATLVTDIPAERRLFASMNNAGVAARLAAELMTVFAKGRKVAVFAGDMSIALHQSLISNFAAGGEGQFDVIHIFDTKDSPDTADMMAVQALERYPDLNGIYISSANSSAICRRIEESGRGGEIAVIASDIFPELASYIRKGIVRATIFQDPFHQAKTALKSLFFYLTEKKPVEPMILSTPQVVLKSNLSLYEFH